MGNLRTTQTKNWDDIPLVLTIEQIMEYLGYSRPVVSAWFEIKDFPVYHDGGKKVEKNLLRAWLYKKHAKGLEEILINEKVNEEIQNKMDNFIEEFENKLNKICDDLTEKSKKEDELKTIIKCFTEVLIKKEMNK